MQKKRIKIVVVLGPTAAGKTKLAAFLAGKFSGEVISADSRQVYRGMDVGTGKDVAEYGKVPYHLIDVVEPLENYNLMRFRADAPRLIQEIDSRGHLPLLAGGSAMYIDAILSVYALPGGPPDSGLREKLNSKSNVELLEMLDEQSPGFSEASRNQNNRNRLIRTIERAVSPSEKGQSFPFDPDFLIIGVYFDRKIIHSRIAERLKSRFQEGMVKEVERLHERGVSWERLEYFGLEYKYIALYLQNKMTYTEMTETLLAKIRQFAKRQDIWFRKMERGGRVIHWIPGGDEGEVSELVSCFLREQPLPQPVIRISEIYYGEKTS